MASTVKFPETADIDSSSDDYALRFSGKLGEWLLKVQEHATLKTLSPYPNATVLDVGGGHGQTAQALIENGYQLTVLGSAEICKHRIQSLVDAQQCAFQVGNLLELPYPDQAFDVVLSYRLLAHVNQWEKYLSELARVAKKAVVLDYASVNSANSIAPYLFKFKKGLEGNTRPFACFHESELIQVFNSLGYEFGDRYPQFFLPMVLHRALKSPAISASCEQVFRTLGLTHLWGSPVILKVVRAENS